MLQRPEQRLILCIVCVCSRVDVEGRRGFPASTLPLLVLATPNEPAPLEHLQSWKQVRGEVHLAKVLVEISEGELFRPVAANPSEDPLRQHDPRITPHARERGQGVTTHPGTDRPCASDRYRADGDGEGVGPALFVEEVEDPRDPRDTARMLRRPVSNAGKPTILRLLAFQSIRVTAQRSSASPSSTSRRGGPSCERGRRRIR